MLWYNKVITDKTCIPDMLNYYDSELDDARREVKIIGNLENNQTKLPGQVEQRFAQLQEIEAILNYLNLRLKRIRREYFQKYLESYNRALTSRDAEKYCDGEEEVIDFEIIINEVALLRNKYLGIMKGFETKNYMLGYITKLRCAGMENISVNT
jgi:hypothetical protein